MIRVLFAMIVLGTLGLVTYALCVAASDHTESEPILCCCGRPAAWWLDTDGLERLVCHFCFGKEWNAARANGATCAARVFGDD